VLVVSPSTAQPIFCYRAIRKVVGVAQVLVRNLPESVKDALKTRAQRHGVSMEAEIRAILQSAVLSSDLSGVGLGTRIRQRFAGLEGEAPFPELRGQQPRPAEFDLDASTADHQTS